MSEGTDDSLAKVFEHETERRGRICHGIGAVQYDEAIEIGVV